MEAQNRFLQYDALRGIAGIGSASRIKTVHERENFKKIFYDYQYNNANYK
jgi:hypothetical protein